MKCIYRAAAVALALPVGAAHAQTQSPGALPGETTSVNLDSLAYRRPLLQRPLAVSLLVGTQGIGLEGRLGIRPRLNVRLGGAYLPANTSGVVTVEKVKSDVTLDSKLGNVHLLAEFQPFRAKGFRLVGGAAYFFSADATVNLKPQGSYTYGDIAVTKEQVGDVTGTVDWSGVAPYLGLGLFKAFPRNRFNASLDLGTYYLSKPKVNIVGTGMLSGNESNEPVVEENIKSYRWLPVLQLSLTYKIH